MSAAVIKKSTLLIALLAASMGIAYFALGTQYTVLFALSFILGVMITATIKPGYAALHGVTLAVLLGVTVAIGPHGAFLPLIVGVAGLVTMFSNRLSSGLFSLAPAYVATTGFIVSGIDPWIAGLISLVGFGYGGVLAHFGKIRLTRHPMKRTSAQLHGLLIAVTGAAVTWACLFFNIAEPQWLILATLLVMRPQVHEAFKRMVIRAGATLIGAFIAVLIILVLPQPLIAIACLILGVLFFGYVLTNQYFKQILLVTTLLIVVMSWGQGIDNELHLALERAGLTVLGSAVAAVAYSIGLGLRHLYVKISHQKTNQ